MRTTNNTSPSWLLRLADMFSAQISFSNGCRNATITRVGNEEEFIKALHRYNYSFCRGFNREFEVELFQVEI